MYEICEDNSNTSAFPGFTVHICRLSVKIGVIQQHASLTYAILHADFCQAVSHRDGSDFLESIVPSAVRVAFDSHVEDALDANRLKLLGIAFANRFWAQIQKAGNYDTDIEGHDCIIVVL